MVEAYAGLAAVMDGTFSLSRTIGALAAVASIAALAVAVIATGTQFFRGGSARSGSPTVIRPVSPPSLGAPPLERAVDQRLQGLKTGRIVFNAPQELGLHDSAVIELHLSRRKRLSALLAEVRELGEKRGAVIQVSPVMAAHLAGLSFAIEPIVPEEQAVSESRSTVWKWELKPTESGTHRLHLAMLVLVNLNGRGTPRSVGTYDTIIEIHVSAFDRTKQFVEGNWQWLWVAIVAPITGWFLKKRKDRGATEPLDRSVPSEGGANAQGPREASPKARGQKARGQQEKREGHEPPPVQ